jgi:hypothetical protein
MVMPGHPRRAHHRAIQDLCRFPRLYDWSATKTPAALAGFISLMRTLVLAQRVQVHTVFRSSLSQLLCHWCLRTRKISSAFMASGLLRKQHYLGGHPNVTEYEERPSSVTEASPTEDFKRSSEDIAPGQGEPAGEVVDSSHIHAPQPTRPAWGASPDVTLCLSPRLAV